MKRVDPKILCPRSEIFLSGIIEFKFALILAPMDHPESNEIDWHTVSRASMDAQRYPASSVRVDRGVSSCYRKNVFETSKYKVSKGDSIKKNLSLQWSRWIEKQCKQDPVRPFMQPVSQHCIFGNVKLRSSVTARRHIGIFRLRVISLSLFRFSLRYTTSSVTLSRCNVCNREILTLGDVTKLWHSFMISFYELLTAFPLCSVTKES